MFSRLGETRLNHIRLLWGIPLESIIRALGIRGCISAVDFYQHNSGGQSSELHKNILEWLPAVIAAETAGPEVEATVQVVIAALREAMFKPTMIALEATAAEITKATAACPVDRDDLTAGVRKRPHAIQEAKAA